MLILFLVVTARAGDINLTVSEMLPILTNKEAAGFWVEDTAKAAQTGNLESQDPNNKNTFIALKDKMPPVWMCTDGVDKDKITFPCWHGDPVKCTPEWHKLLELECPVICTLHILK